MKFALVGPTIEENLSLGYLAAALRCAGHEADVISFVHDADAATVARRIAARGPDVVGLSMTFQSRGRGFLALATELRAAGFRGHLTAGGHWASVAAEPLLRDHPALDSIVRGEADDSLAALADALRDGRPLDAVPGIALRRAGRTVHGPQPVKRDDLDALPFPARDDPPLLHLGVPSAPLVASRGCRGHCTFCSIGTFGRLSRGPARRARSADSVADEMAALHRDRAVRVFVFHDDDFFSGDAAADLAFAERLREALRTRGLPPVALIVKARPDDVHDAVLDALLELGLVRVFLGVETDAPAGLRALGRTLDPGANRRALHTLRRRGVFVCSNLLLWEPDTTLDDLRANLALLRAFPGQIFNLARTELYEGAPLTARVERQGRLRGDYLGRDYLVADPRAELAWRVFRVALGERCYPLHGVVNAAMGLGYDAHLLRRFFPSDRADRLAAAALALVGRTAQDTAAWLARIVEYAAVAPLGPHPEVLQFALDAARAVHAEDARLLAELHDAQEALERCARGEPEPAPGHAANARPRRLGRAAALAAATALLACHRGGAPGVHEAAGGAPADADAVPAAVDAGGGTDFSAAPPADDAGPAAATADSDEITLEVSEDESSWEQCQGGPARVGSFRLSVLYNGPEALFDRFDATDGTIGELYVAPDGQRAQAMLTVGAKPGRQRITAVFRRTAAGAGTIRRSAFIYQYGPDEERGGNVATSGPDPQPKAQCYQICDMAAPPPDSVLETAGPVVFTQAPYSSLRGWAATFRFSVGLRATVTGELVDRPTITCSAGSATLSPSYGGGYRSPEPPQGPPAAPPLRDAFDVYYDPRPADGSGRLQGGHQYCEVTYKVRDGGTERDIHGRVDIRIEPDGNVDVGGPSQPEAPPPADTGDAGAPPATPGPAARRAPYPDLPLPLRYAVRLRCLADYGDAVLLGADCPPTADASGPSFLWSASAGTIEPVDGGARAVWRLPDDGAPAVALCAVQSAPLDLQVAAYRRG